MRGAAAVPALSVVGLLMLGSRVPATTLPGSAVRISNTFTSRRRVIRNSELGLPAIPLGKRLR